jgi:hypothetical protein
MKKHCFYLSLLASLLVMTVLISPAQSATVAYWRFDAGPANTPVLRPAGVNGYTFSPDVPDVSGNGNHLAVWSQAGGAGFNYRSSVPFAVMPQTGQANNFSVQNSGSYPASFTMSSQSNPAGIDIEAITPAQWTIEAFFKPEATETHRTIVGRDATGVTGDAALAALYFQIRPDQSVAIAFADVSGYWHVAGSEAGLIEGFNYSSDNLGLTGRWYFMAAVSDGATLSLYLANITDGGPLELVAQTDLTESGSPDTSLAKGTNNGNDWHAGGWSVGRGLWNGGHTDRAWGFIDEVRISNHAVDPAHFLYSPRTNAWNPTPADSARGVGTTPDGQTITVDLRWNTGMLESDLTQVNPDIVMHYLYMSEDQNLSDDPNLYWVADIPATGPTGQATVAGLNYDGTYLWRVDEAISINGSPSPKNDPNTITGPLWTFSTLLSVPVITKHPVGMLVDAGVTVELVTEAESVSPPQFQWYKSADGVRDPETDPTVGDPSPDGVLTLTNVSVADEGYYYCVVSNGSGRDAMSDAAFVEIKRLKAWYAFENNLTDSAEDNDGTALKADPNFPFDYAAGVVGQAIVFSGEEAVEVPRSIQDSFTIALWVKTEDIGGTGGWWNGHGLVDGEMPGSTTDFGTVVLNGKFGFGVGAPDTTISSATDINDNEWHYCVATRDHVTGQMRLYVDGELEAAAVGGTGRRAAPPVLNIGRIQTGINYLNGQIDEARLFNYPLDAKTVASEYYDLSGNDACYAPPALDFNGDCVVGLEDFALFAAHWLNCGLVPDCLP